MSAAGALVLIMLIVVVLCGSRLQALLAMLCGILFLSQAQHVNLAGLNLFAIRFLEVAGCARVLARQEFSWQRFNKLDWAVVWLYVYTTLVFLLRSSEGYANAIAIAVDAGLCYVIFRGLIRNLGDFVGVLRLLPFVLVPYVLLLAFERKTGYPALPFMSSGQEGIFIRDGAPRCMGSFRNPDTLGTVGATFFACYIGLAFSRSYRWRAGLGIVLCLAIVWFSNSGGSLSSAGMAVAGWLLWRFRDKMQQVRWGIVAMLVALALVMKAPVWYILDRVSQVTGGTGWHRAYLIDVAVRHLSEWWLIGMPIRDTQDWFHYTIGVTGGADITNWYIWFGLTAGLGAIALLILVLTRAYGRLGRALARARRAGPRLEQRERILFGMGVMLTVHLVNWLGISYFDQIYAVWLMQLAAISGATTLAARPRKPAPFHSRESSDEVPAPQPEMQPQGAEAESSREPVSSPRA